LSLGGNEKFKVKKLDLYC